jgi:tetratricopeptide (TPR) repeat protein
MTYNDEHVIGMAIKSCLALSDEVIVVDLGSRDNTRLVAEGYGARVLEHTFNGDYAAVRNLALDEASCEWALMLNSNEVFSKIRPVDFQRLLDADVGGYNIDIVSDKTGQTVSVVENLRLFRLDSRVRYKYPARERIDYSFRKWQSVTGFDDIEDTDRVKIIQDTSRTVGISNDRGHIIHLLRKGLLTNPEEPYFEYAIACETIVEVEGEVLPVSSISFSLTDLEKSWQKILTLAPKERMQLDYLPNLMIKLAACYLASGQIQSAWQITSKALESYPENAFIQLQYVAVGVAYLREVIKDHHDPAAQPWEEQLLAVIRLLEQSRVDDKYVARYSGELALFRGEVDIARDCFRVAMSADINYSYAWLGLAQCQMYLGETNKAIQLYLEATQRNEDNYRAWLQGSNLLEEIGFANNAAAWRSLVASKFPRLAESSASG